VVAVRRLVAQLAVALARDLARVHHQTAGDESFADALSHVSCGVQLAARGDARDTMACPLWVKSGRDALKFRCLLWAKNRHQRRLWLSSARGGNFLRYLSVS
jgi:hypothetical protein